MALKKAARIEAQPNIADLSLDLPVGNSGERWRAAEPLVPFRQIETARQVLLSRQQLGQLRFDQINRIHVPVALGSMLLPLPLLMLGWRRAPFADLSRLAATATVALLANAVVCGVLSNPHDRYGARMAWLAPLIVTLVLVRLFERRRVPAPGVPALTGDTTAAA